MKEPSNRTKNYLLDLKTNRTRESTVDYFSKIENNFL